MDGSPDQNRKTRINWRRRQWHTTSKFAGSWWRWHTTRSRSSKESCLTLKQWKSNTSNNQVCLSWNFRSLLIQPHAILIGNNAIALRAPTCGGNHQLPPATWLAAIFQMPKNTSSKAEQKNRLPAFTTPSRPETPTTHHHHEKGPSTILCSFVHSFMEHWEM